MRTPAAPAHPSRLVVLIVLLLTAAWLNETYAGHSSAAEAAFQQSTAETDGPLATSTVVAGHPGVNGNTYVSPRYGYSLTWDETWTATESTSDDRGDTLRITNGTVTADLYSLVGDFEANECNDQLLDALQSDPVYRNADLVTDEAGDPFVSGDQDVAFALLSFTYTDDQGVASDLYDYTACAVLPDRQSLVALDQYVSPEDYAGQVEAMESLQAGLAVSQGNLVVPGGLRVGQTAAPTPDSADEIAYRAVKFETESQIPVFGPIPGGELTLDQIGGGIWPAVVSVTDFRMHLDLEPPPDETEAGWSLAITFRDNSYGFDSVVLSADGSWKAAGLSGNIGRAPVSFDLVAQDDTGRLAINDHYVATLDLSWILPGDITLEASATGAEGSVLGIDNWTIWELLPRGISAPRPANSPVSDDDIRTFNEIRFYPLHSTVFAADGTMPHSADGSSYVQTGVEVTDFGAEIDCLVPGPARPWDCGLVFRDLLSANHYRVVLVSDGTWSLTTGAGDLIQSGSGVPLLTQPGERNKLQLYVAGGVGYFGVNGVLLARLDLSEFPGPGNVGAGTSFTPSTFTEGGETLYEDFVVWILDPGLVESLSKPATPGSQGTS